jgi:hypothetical protein
MRVRGEDEERGGLNGGGETMEPATEPSHRQGGEEEEPVMEPGHRGGGDECQRADPRGALGSCCKRSGDADVEAWARAQIRPPFAHPRPGGAGDGITGADAQARAS